MSAGPRIVFTRFLTGDSPKLAPWVDHLRTVAHAGAAPMAAGSFRDGAVVWQLVSANNRQLARSVEIHSTFEGASAAARRVVSAGSTLRIEHVSEPLRGSYGWFAADGEAPVISCARWYFTERDRRQSIELAIRALTLAELHTGARLIHPALMETGPGPLIS